MPRKAIHQMNNNEKTIDTRVGRKVAWNFNKPRQRCTSQKKATKYVKAPSIDKCDGGSTSKIANKVLAKVDTWRKKQNRVEIEKRQNISPSNEQQKQKKQQQKNFNTQNYLTRQKTKKMLQEVKLLLSAKKFGTNQNTSKSYLRSVQKTLYSSLNRPCIDPEILSLVHEPIKKNFDKANNENMWRDSHCVFESDSNNLNYKYNTLGTKSLVPRNETKKAVERKEPIDKYEDTSEKTKEYDTNKTNVKTLLTFWNEKISDKPTGELSYPQRNLPLTTHQSKNVLKLSTDGVAEEHTLKPSDFKFGNGPPGIAELLIMNSRKTICRAKSQKTIPINNKKENVVLNVKSKDQIIIRYQKNGAFNRKKNKQGYFTENRTIHLWKQSILHSTSNKSTCPKSICNTKMKKRNFMKNDFRVVEELKKENFTSTTYPYIYVVKCLFGYAEMLKPGIYRPRPEIVIPARNIDVIACNHDRSQRYINFGEYRLSSTNSQKENPDELTISIDKISILTGIKLEVLYTLLQIMNKKSLPGNMCKLSRSELDKLSQIGNDLITTESSLKDKFLYCLDNIEKIFSFNKGYIKVAYLKTTFYLPKLPLAIREIRNLGAREMLSFWRHKLYFMTTLSLVLLFLLLLLATSI